MAIRFLKIALSVLIWIYYIILFLLFFPFVLITYLVTFTFDRYQIVANLLFMQMAKFMMYINPGWKIKFYGLHKLEKDKSTIYVANHQSFMDLPLLALLPEKMKWVSKRSLFKIPILGWMIKMSGHLSINRTKKTAIKRLDNLVEPLKNGVSVMIFPEGTRSLDGNLRNFRNGAFLLAEKHGFLLQPIVTEGTIQVLPSHRWIFEPSQEIQVHVLDSIDPRNYSSVTELRDATHEIMRQKLAAIRNEEIKSPAQHVKVA